MSKARAHLYASQGPAVLKLLSGAHDSSQADTFGNVIADQLFDYAQGGDTALITPLMQAFIDQTCPAPVNMMTARWVCMAYLKHRHNRKPMLAEDLYKLRDDLAYFDAVKKSPSFKLNKDNADLQSYKSYAALKKTLARYQAQRNLREDARKAFHISDSDREIIEKETTLLYDGGEGKVVIAHTTRASQYWGRNTKWCISGGDADKFFPSYTAQRPAIMLLPKKGGSTNKMALVAQTLWTAQDQQILYMTGEHRALWDAMIAHQGAIKQDALEQFLPANAHETPQRYRLPPLNADEAAALEEFSYYGYFPGDEDEGSFSPSLVAALCAYEPQYYHDLPRALKTRAFALAMAHERGALIDGTAHARDRAIVLAAVKRNGMALLQADNHLQKDDEICRAAVAASPQVYEYLPPYLQQDAEVIDSVLRRNGAAIFDMWGETVTPARMQLAAINMPHEIETYSMLSKFGADRDMWARVFLMTHDSKGGGVNWDKKLKKSFGNILVNNDFHRSWSEVKTLIKTLRRHAPVYKLLLAGDLITEGHHRQARHLIGRAHQQWGDVDSQFGDASRAHARAVNALGTQDSAHYAMLQKQAQHSGSWLPALPVPMFTRMGKILFGR